MLQFYSVKNAVMNRETTMPICFTTAPQLGQYLESRGVVFSGNGVNDLSKHYGQHIITRLLDGIRKAGPSCRYGYEDFPKMIVTDNMGDGYVVAENLKRRGAIHPSHIKPFVQNGVELFALDVFSMNAVEQLLSSWGLRICNGDYIINELPAGVVYMEFNGRNGVITPNSNKKPLWANSTENTSPVNTKGTNSNLRKPDENFAINHTDSQVEPKHVTTVNSPTNVYCPPSKQDKLNIILNAINQIEGELDLIKSLINDFTS